MAVAATRLARLTGNWVYGGSLVGLLLLLFTPALSRGWSPTLLLVFLTLPAYMLHQYEEHDADRFRLFVNEKVGRGRELLTPLDVFVINVGFVWLGLSLAILVAFRFGTGWGVVAGWFLVINAIVHLADALALRRYNPGLWSGLVLFLPLGLATLFAAGAHASLAQQAIGLGLVVALHAGIVALALSRRGRP